VVDGVLYADPVATTESKKLVGVQLSEAGKVLGVGPYLKEAHDYKLL